MDDEVRALEIAIEEIEGIARGFGLDFFPMNFELIPADIMYTFGAYGMPTRFAHWSFGKAFQRMKTFYDYNLSRIYELVINSNPCYAFLLEGNSLMQNKLVAAHVYGHNDFFKNNAYFQSTSRQMVETMAVHARRVREYEYMYGRREVEIFLDALLSIQEHFNPYKGKDPAGGNAKGAQKTKESPYEDLLSLGSRGSKDNHKEERKPKKIPPAPEKDLLQFIVEYSQDLEDWQRNLVSMAREEINYFWPQMTTKILNEGWASYWHSRIIRSMDLNEEDTLEFAKLHSMVLQSSKTSLNPYYLGLKVLENIERLGGGETGGGREAIFEIREIDNDVSLLRNHLTRELVEELDLYLYQKTGQDWVVVEKEWEKVRDGLVQSLTNCGFPWITVEDGDYQHKGEIYLLHQYEGVELDLPYLENTLPHVFLLWGKTVHLQTIVDGKPVLFSYDGKKNSRQIIKTT